MNPTREEALHYHRHGRAGKISVVPTKPCSTVKDLSLAYTPGVAHPCLEIHQHPEQAYHYTAKGNLVAVITNGTAVLGLGNIGPLAGKPVMEGKAVLFKRLAGIDAIDLEIQEHNPARVSEIIAALEPTFGGVNLEDIKAPECFEIEEQLLERMNIPVFHDDQHGTAVIVAAGLLNALELVGKKINTVKIVFSGAGAAAIACATMLRELGAKKEQLFLCDSTGVVTTSRKEGMNNYKAQFAQNSSHLTLADVLRGADVFIGVSKGNLLTAEMLHSMSRKPIIFALANPTPEISYDDARHAVPDSIVATGRSDYPNQVNNVLGFPFIFRGALDVRASRITQKMKVAASKALAALAHEPVAEEVVAAYGRSFSFGPEYLLPKPFDPRLLYRVAPAVAAAAMNEGVARTNISLRAYTDSLRELSGRLAQGGW